MVAENSVTQISCRFGKDRLEIVEFVNFMRDHCAIHIHSVAELNTTLGRFGISEFATRKFLGTDHHLTPSEISDLVDAIDRITPVINSLTSKLELGLDDIPMVQQDGTPENQNLLSEWIDYAMHQLPEDPRH